MFHRTRLSILGVAGVAVLTEAWAAAGPAAPELRPTLAAHSPVAAQATMLGAARAGQRVVGVGDHGVVLLSDDDGAHFRQAATVPVSSTLTGVSFVDASHGWAVGHWGAVLATTDGGEHWRVQRLVTDDDRPLFAVHFFDRLHGMAVGLWSLVLTTADGGLTWVPRPLDAPAGSKKADLNLMGLFADGRGNVYAAGERGQVLRSDDRGQTWRYLDTGYKGTLWCGAVLADGSLLVGGQRGTLLRSSNEGRSWERLPLDSTSSVTAVTSAGDRVAAVGLDGLQAFSTNRGLRFAAARRADGASLTAVLAGAERRWILFSRRGVAEEAAGR